MDERQRRIEVRKLLAPDGQPIGKPGRRRTNIRVVSGGAKLARELLSKLEALGEREWLTGYDGISINLGGKDRVGLREKSGSGEPTLDVTISYVPEVWKIKFDQDDLDEDSDD